MRFTRSDWARLRADTPLTLDEAELERLRGQNEYVSLEEVSDIYLPLTRLLNLYVAATDKLYVASADFLGKSASKVPYIIGIAGSVAVGKSTTARILQALLASWPAHPRVELVATDGFLFPNSDLEERGLMRKKGFPESFDLGRLIQFITDVKGGHPEVRIPIYSHHGYDIIPGRYQVIRQPDIVIVEGLNVLQSGGNSLGYKPRVFISDFFDFTIYAHAEAAIIREWYVNRFMAFRNLAQGDNSSYFHRFAHMSEEEVLSYAGRIWSEINEVNLLENILPTRERAQLILNKGRDHSVRNVLLRKL